jgi:ureidoacrylate peracid hydrolase
MNKCLAPNRVAVLVIDMQNDFCSVDGYIERSLGKSAERCRAIAQPIMELVGAARSVMAPVIWIKADYSLDLIPCHMRAKRIERGIEAVCCAPTDWGSEFYGVRPDPTEPIVVKHCYSGFIGTDLETILHNLRAYTLVFAGVQTNVCVETTLRDAASRGFYPIVASDCVASHTHHLHEASIENIRTFFGGVADRSTIARLWRSYAQ